MSEQKEPSVEEVREAIKSNDITTANHLKNYSDEIIAEGAAQFVRWTVKHPGIEWNDEFAKEYIRREEGREKDAKDP